MKVGACTILPACAVAIIWLAACERRSSEAIVLTKEHIAATGTDQRPASLEPDAASKGESVRPMRDGEIALDGYVMKPEVRGTSRDPRALKDEQWLVKVRTVQDGRTFKVPSDQSQFEKLKEGDRVRVSYGMGKYTGTVWSAKIEGLARESHE